MLLRYCVPFRRVSLYLAWHCQFFDQILQCSQLAGGCWILALAFHIQRFIARSFQDERSVSWLTLFQSKCYKKILWKNASKLLKGVSLLSATRSWATESLNKYFPPGQQTERWIVKNLRENANCYVRGSWLS